MQNGTRTKRTKKGGRADRRTDGAPIKSCLKTISLCSQLINIDGAKALAEVLRTGVCPKLKELTMSNNKLDSESVQHLR